MDWLRSEDLKEEKVVTTPVATIPRPESCVPALNWPVMVRTRDIMGLWARRKPRNNRPKRHSHILRNEVLVVENDVEK
jgi:hypothetical protein